MSGKACPRAATRKVRSGFPSRQTRRVCAEIMLNQKPRARWRFKLIASRSRQGFREGAGHDQEAGICRPHLARDEPEMAPQRSARHRGDPGQGTGQGGKAAPQQLAARSLRAVAAGKPDAVEAVAEVLELQGLGLTQPSSERRLSEWMRAPVGALVVSAHVRSSPV